MLELLIVVGIIFNGFFAGIFGLMTLAMVPDIFSMAILGVITYGFVTATRKLLNKYDDIRYKKSLVKCSNDNNTKTTNFNNNSNNVKYDKKRAKAIERIKRQIIDEIKAENDKITQRNINIYASTQEGREKVNNMKTKIYNFDNKYEAIKMKYHQNGIKLDFKKNRIGLQKGEVLNAGKSNASIYHSNAWVNTNDINLVQISCDVIPVKATVTKSQGKGNGIAVEGFIGVHGHMKNNTTSVTTNGTYAYRYIVKIDYRTIIMIDEMAYDIDELKQLIINSKTLNREYNEVTNLKKDKNSILIASTNLYKSKHPELFEDYIVLTDEQIMNRAIDRYESQ